jgi:hypothetical protein
VAGGVAVICADLDDVGFMFDLLLEVCPYGLDVRVALASSKFHRFFCQLTPVRGASRSVIRQMAYMLCYIIDIF